MKMDHKRRLEDRLGATSSTLAPNTKIKGTIEGDESIVIKGHLTGDVLSKGLVWLDKGGQIQGQVKSPYVIVDGELIGNIKSAERVELRTESRMIGNIETESLAVAEGAVFEGEVHMPQRQKDAISFVEKRKK
ncbi:polymer-forming cytoskeletal protein [Acidobacteriota bacterium]